MDYDDDRYRYAGAASRGRPGRGYNDYDDPRRSGEDEAYMRSMVSRSDEGLYDRPRTMADRLDATSGASYVSPLQGAKIQVSNLQQSVSQDDITELFGDIGPLKRAKLVDEVRTSWTFRAIR